MQLKQIVVSIENSPSRLYNVLHELSSAGINLRALNLVDTGAFGQLRLLVSDVAKARRILMEMNIPAYINEVIAAEIDDKPGSLSNLLRPLMEANVRIKFMYSFIGKAIGKAIMIFRFSENQKAISILQQHGATILDATTFGISELNNQTSEEA